MAWHIAVFTYLESIRYDPNFKELAPLDSKSTEQLASSRLAKFLARGVFDVYELLLKSEI